MRTCPCCAETLLHHISGGRCYWFCSHCWQEMPVIDTAVIPKLHHPSLGFPQSDFIPL